MVVRAQAPAGTTDLVLLLDASNSINSADWQLQKDGYVAALQDRVAFPLDGSVAVGVLQWSDTVTVEIPLTVIDGEETVGRLAAAIQAIAQVRGGTQPGDGLRAGTEELLDSGREDTDWFLCMSQTVLAHHQRVPEPRARTRRAGGEPGGSGLEQLRAPDRRQGRRGPGFRADAR